MALLLMAPRVYYAMSQDGLFPRAIARLHPRRGVPDRATLLLAALATGFTLVGTFQQIVSFFICTAIAFIALAVSGLFVMRRRDPRVRGVCAPGYPITPTLFIALAAAVVARAPGAAAPGDCRHLGCLMRSPGLPDQPRRSACRLTMTSRCGN